MTWRCFVQWSAPAASPRLRGGLACPLYAEPAHRSTDGSRHLLFARSTTQNSPDRGRFRRCFERYAPALDADLRDRAASVQMRRQPSRLGVRRVNAMAGLSIEFFRMEWLAESTPSIQTSAWISCLTIQRPYRISERISLALRIGISDRYRLSRYVGWLRVQWFLAASPAYLGRRPANHARC